MKKTITTCICMILVGGSAMAQNYQIPNSDFEVWNDVNEPGNGWYSFVSAVGDAAGLGKPFSKGNTTKVVGKWGSAAQIVSKSVFGVKANGNLTTGRINMGSSIPTNATNYNFTDKSGNSNNCLFVGLPDSVSCWTKFTRGENKEYFAQGNFVLHGNIDYKDPHETEANVTAHRIAGGTIKITPSTAWTYFSAPMEYTGVEAEKMYMLGSFTTNPTPGATAGDKLQIDDVKFIYNSKLASLSIKGTPLAGFDKDIYTYIIKDELRSEDDIVAVSDGKGAQVNIEENDDCTVFNIIITGNDGVQNQHIYSLVKEGAIFGATSIKLNDIELDGFDSKILSYKDLEMPNGIYPTVSVSSDRTLTSVDMQLNEAKNTITIVVTDKVNDNDYTYTLTFNPSAKVISGPQIKGDFEKQTQWGPDAIDGKKWGTVADGWFSSNVTQLGAMNFVMVEEESHQVGDDLYAIKTVNGRPGAMGVESNAPGYIALGTPWVYADMIGLMSTVFPGGLPDTDDSDGGTIGGVNFTYQPDSIVGYYKRTYADAESGLLGMNPKEDAKIIAYLWKGTSVSMASATDGFETTGSAWQLLVDREIDILGTKNNGTPADGITLIASAEETVKELTDWTRVAVPLNYVSDEKPEKANVVISSADYFNRANIGNGNTLSADDVKFIYNSKLASLSIKDTPLEGFDKETYMYTLDELPTKEEIVAISDAKGALVEISGSENFIKITVTGNDGAPNQHVYTLVKKDAVFSATSINLNDAALEGFDSAVTSYENLAMPNGIYPTVSVASDPVLTSVDMQLNDATKTITIVVTDKVSKADHTYTLKFTSSDRIANGPQIKGNFEVQTQWGPDMMDAKRWGTVAEGWFSSNVTQMGSMNFVMVEKEFHPVGEDLYAVKAINGRPGLSTAVSNAPGYISLGTPWVYADVIGLLTETSDAMPIKNDKDDSDGGTIGGVGFTYQPDSIVGYYKRTYADATSGLGGMNPKEDAKIIAYLWKGTSASMAPATAPGFESLSAITGSHWQLLVDREIDILGTKNNGTPADGITLIASAEETVKELTDWTRVAVPLNYVSEEKPEKANVVISSADYFNRANIGNGNTLSADDVAFVYNSKLKSITIDGAALNGFAKNTYAYELDGIVPTTTDGIVAVPDGKGATVEVAIKGKVVTIKVKGNDIADNASNLHTYTLTFKFATGIDQSAEDKVSVKGIVNGAIVEGAQLGERVEVYSVQGMLIGQYTANGTLNINGLTSNTVYLVKIGSYVTRILTK